MRAAAWYGAGDIACPPQYLPGKEQIFRNSVRDRQDFGMEGVDSGDSLCSNSLWELNAEATDPVSSAKASA